METRGKGKTKRDHSRKTSRLPLTDIPTAEETRNITSQNKSKSLRFWAEKLQQLEKQQQTKKRNDLYEFSPSEFSPDNSSRKKKPKPRRKKENMHGVSAKSGKCETLDDMMKRILREPEKRKGSSRKPTSRPKNEGELIKERVLYNKAQRMNGSFTFDKPSTVFGLSSTPSNKNLNIVKPSFFGFDSPINNSLAPGRLLTSAKGINGLSLTNNTPYVSESSSEEERYYSANGSKETSQAGEIAIPPISKSFSGFSPFENESDKKLTNFKCLKSPVSSCVETLQKSIDSINGHDLSQKDSLRRNMKTRRLQVAQVQSHRETIVNSRERFTSKEISEYFDDNNDKELESQQLQRPVVSRVGGDTGIMHNYDSVIEVAASPAAHATNTMNNHTTLNTSCEEGATFIDCQSSDSLSEQIELAQSPSNVNSTSNSSQLEAITSACDGYSSSSNSSQQEAALNPSNYDRDINGVSDEQIVDGKLFDQNVTIRRRRYKSNLNSNELSQHDSMDLNIISPTSNRNLTIRKRQYNNISNCQEKSHNNVADSDEMKRGDRNVTSRRRRYTRSTRGYDVSHDSSVSKVNSPSCNRNVTIRRRKLDNILNCDEQSAQTLHVTAPRASSTEDDLNTERNVSKRQTRRQAISSKDFVTKSLRHTRSTNSPVISGNVPHTSPHTKLSSESDSNKSDVMEALTSNDYISPYFSLENNLVNKCHDEPLGSDNKSSTDTSFVVSSEEDEQKGCAPNQSGSRIVLRKTILPCGKQHHRARNVLRNLQSGRLTLHNISTFPEGNITRGKAYEPFIESILEMQPGFGESVLSRTVRTFESDEKRKTICQKGRLTIMMKRLSENFNESQRISNGIPARNISKISKDVRNKIPETECTFNTTLRVVSVNNHISTDFRSAFGIGDTTADNVTLNETNDETMVASPLTAKDVVLSRCCQTEPLRFDENFNEQTIPNCKKIGEGLYGEVFMYTDLKCSSTVFKVIPIEGDIKVNDEPQKSFADILSEIVITMELSNLRQGENYKCDGFAELRRAWCVQGAYPDFLVNLWEQYDDKKGSENDHPGVFDEYQLYIVLELAHGGQDLEAFVFNNAKQAASAFQQATLSLAVAEGALQFEHRDFHWGNVLVSKTEDKFVSYVINGKEFILKSEGVKVAIIDFTLSRMSYDGCSIFNDLSQDNDLFTSEGDYQFDIYRLMREENQNDWEPFCPRTNVLWLHYVLDKMVTLLRYARPNSKAHKQAICTLKDWKSFALDYDSAAALFTAVIQ